MLLKVIIFFAATLSWTVYRVRNFLRNKQLKEAFLYCCLMGLCIVLGSLLIFHIQILRTTIPLRSIFEPMGKIILMQ
ncbi:hypothetical protein PAESOLCIP111_01075 [Paenibacillus solanacearum]|uniref:Uncharacterized protein n=1 Tax=Paenibacillus solanacearum TaxID=2048548 RepID=A0A916JVR7_9BACL|nr:hypothetical protein PAESOLCIP111_01075 [Paenibacillus solanacearum]